MKTILALLILACASHAFQIDDISEYNYGFYSALGINYDQHTEIQSCVADIYELYDDVLTLMNATRNGLEDTLNVTTQLIEAVSTDDAIVNDCEAYKAILVSYIQQNAVVPLGSSFGDAVRQNAYVYSAEILQAAADWAEDIASGQFYFAGQHQANVLQILIGAYTPSYPVPAFNISKYVPFNSSKFYAEFYQKLFNDLGFTNQTDLDTLIGCGIAVQDYIFTVIHLRSELPSADLQTRMVIYLQGAEYFFDLLQTCDAALKVELRLNAPLFETFKSSPISTVVHLLFNIVANLPEIEQDQKEYIVAIEQGEYSYAADINAQEQLKIFNGIYNFNLTQQI